MDVFTVMGALLLTLSMYPIWQFIETEEEYRASHALYDFAPIQERNHVSFGGHKVTGEVLGSTIGIAGSGTGEILV